MSRYLGYSHYYFRNDSPLVNFVVNKNPVLLADILEYFIWRNMTDDRKPNIILCHANIEYVLNSQHVYCIQGKLVHAMQMTQSNVAFYEKRFRSMKFESAPENINQHLTIKRCLRLAINKYPNHVF